RQLLRAPLVQGGGSGRLVRGHACLPSWVSPTVRDGGNARAGRGRLPCRPPPTAPVAPAALPLLPHRRSGSADRRRAGRWRAEGPAPHIVPAPGGRALRGRVAAGPAPPGMCPVPRPGGSIGRPPRRGRRVGSSDETTPGAGAKRRPGARVPKRRRTAFPLVRGAFPRGPEGAGRCSDG